MLALPRPNDSPCIEAPQSYIEKPPATCFIKHYVAGTLNAHHISA